jgi:hypothetical protein
VDRRKSTNGWRVKALKGIIFNLLERVVADEHGDDAWDDLLERAEVDGTYTALGNYPDAELLLLLSLMPEAFGGSQVGQLRWFGRKAMPMLAERYAIFFAEPRDTPAFLLTLNNVIHAEVRKLYPDADVPTFTFDPIPGVEPPPGDSLVLGYRSGRMLCGLAEGFIEGAAAHYSQAVRIEQPRCMLRGDEACAIVCAFEPASPSARPAVDVP